MEIGHLYFRAFYIKLGQSVDEEIRYPLSHQVEFYGCYFEREILSAIRIDQVSE